MKSLFYLYLISCFMVFCAYSQLDTEGDAKEPATADNAGTNEASENGSPDPKFFRKKKKVMKLARGPEGDSDNADDRKFLLKKKLMKFKRAPGVDSENEEDRKFLVKKKVMKFGRGPGGDSENDDGPSDPKFFGKKKIMKFGRGPGGDSDDAPGLRNPKFMKAGRRFGGPSAENNDEPSEQPQE